jgi:hypothetical protein
MDKKVPAAPIITAAIVIALIAGVSGWMVHTRTADAPQPMAADTAGAEQVVERAPAAAPSPASASSEPMSSQGLLALQTANEASVKAIVDAGENKLRSRYEGERVDAAWASRKQQALERLSVSPQIEQLNAQPLSIDAHCRTSVCLINADFATRLAATDWHTLYTLNAGTEMSNSSMRSTVNPDGSVHLQIYGLARQ